MGFVPPSKLSHLLRDELTLRLTCACGHVAEPDVMTLRSQIWKARKSEDLKDLPRNLRCSVCGERSLTYELVK